MMFDNYRLGVQSTAVDCEYESVSSNDVYVSSSDYVKKDKYGNIVGLCWASLSRFTLDITSDTWIPIADDAIVLTEAGDEPLNIIPDNEIFAYNTVDCRCWKYEIDKWIEEPDITEFKNSNNVVLFSKKDCMTRIVIRNFRDDVVFAADGDGKVIIKVDDELSEMLNQGIYTVEVYRVSDNDTILIRRIPLSISGNISDDTFKIS